MSDLRIGIAVHAGLSDELHDALVRIAERCDVAPVSDGGRFDAVVRTAESTPAHGERALVWLDDPEAPVPAWASAVLTAPRTADAVAATAPVPVVPLGPAPRHPSARPLAPFTRDRVRRARGLTGPSVAHGGPDGWTWDGADVPDDAVATAAALASVVVAHDEPAAVLAAAWAAPVVAPADVRAEVGLPDVGDDLEAAAESLLADAVARARHARACRAAYERTYDADGAVRTLATVLGVRPSSPWRTGYADALDGLGTPAGSNVRARAHDALRSLRSHR
ncbi:hypothetical protein OMK64_15650 [Cellulomonas fimi]|uniref:hypothetical protein n=1 Tax=Cellulomonas fimi TaxID=1708 RepID=UPI00234D2801|nr:hypothetical protein [Cellulomonas fimi]MDC7122968.1 hypothetical protein [Cellulomonas fimi]